MPDDDGLWIDGESVKVSDLTFREQRKLREYMRELAPEHDVGQASEADVTPAFIAVVKQRRDPEFTLDQALDFKPGDLEAPDPPTEPAPE